MKNLLWLLASLAWVGCIPVVTGAPCETDANCPDTQRCGTKRVCEARTGSGGGPATGGSGGGDITGGGAGATLPQFLELTSASGRQQGGTVTLDLQVGHPTPRTKMTGGTLELTGAAAVQR